MYDDNIDNPQHDEQFDNEDDIISSEYYSLINRIKNENIWWKINMIMWGNKVI